MFVVVHNRYSDNSTMLCHNWHTGCKFLFKNDAFMFGLFPSEAWQNCGFAPSIWQLKPILRGGVNDDSQHLQDLLAEERCLTCDWKSQIISPRHTTSYHLSLLVHGKKIEIAASIFNLPKNHGISGPSSRERSIHPCAIRDHIPRSFERCLRHVGLYTRPCCLPDGIGLMHVPAELISCRIWYLHSIANFLQNIRCISPIMEQRFGYRIKCRTNVDKNQGLWFRTYFSVLLMHLKLQVQWTAGKPRSTTPLVVMRCGPHTCNHVESPSTWEASG